MIWQALPFLLALFLLDSSFNKLKSLFSVAFFVLYLGSQVASEGIDFSLYWSVQLGFYVWFFAINTRLIKKTDKLLIGLGSAVFSISLFLEFSGWLDPSEKVLLSFCNQLIFLCLPLFTDFIANLTEESEWFLISLQILLARLFLINFSATYALELQMLQLFEHWSFILILFAIFTAVWGWLNAKRGSPPLVYEQFLSSLVIFFSLLEPQQTFMYLVFLSLSQFLLGFDFNPKKEISLSSYSLASLQRGGVGSLPFFICVVGIYKYSAGLGSEEIVLWLFLVFYFGALGWIDLRSVLDREAKKLKLVNCNLKWTSYVIGLVVFAYLAKEGVFWKAL